MIIVCDCKKTKSNTVICKNEECRKESLIDNSNTKNLIGNRGSSGGCIKEFTCPSCGTTCCLEREKKRNRLIR